MSLPNHRVSNLISYLGGRTTFVRLAAEKNIKISLHTVGAWITRNSLPGKHVHTCNLVAAAAGKEINWSKFFSQNSLTRKED